MVKNITLVDTVIEKFRRKVNFKLIITYCRLAQIASFMQIQHKWIAGLAPKK
jgi:hypothetical protein